MPIYLCVGIGLVGINVINYTVKMCEGIRLTCASAGLVKNYKIPILVLQSVNGAEVFIINSLSVGGFSVDIRIFRGGDIAPMLIERAVSYVQITDDDLLYTRALADVPKMPRAVIRKAITERKYLERVCRFCI